MPWDIRCRKKSGAHKGTAREPAKSIDQFIAQQLYISVAWPPVSDHMIDFIERKGIKEKFPVKLCMVAQENVQFGVLVEGPFYRNIVIIDLGSTLAGGEAGAGEEKDVSIHPGNTLKRQIAGKFVIW